MAIFGDTGLNDFPSTSQNHGGAPSTAAATAEAATRSPAEDLEDLEGIMQLQATCAPCEYTENFDEGFGYIVV